MLDIEVVDIRKINSNSALRAFADLKINDSLIIHGFSVMKGKNGVFVKMPGKPSKDGKWFDVLRPTSDAVKREIEDKVLEAYDQEVDGKEG